MPTKRKQQDDSQLVPDDRFAAFLDDHDDHDDSNELEQDANLDQDDDLNDDELSHFPRQPLPPHLLPKHLAAASSSSSAADPSGSSAKAKQKHVKTPGLIYLSRIPPGMGPGKVKHLLSSFGEVGRIYLARADAGKDQANLKKKYKQKERHQSHNFKEGWVEFLDKRVARSVADMLNAQTIGGKKSDRWHDDVWTMKYLPRFRWDQLSEQVALERATQTSLLRFHLSHSKQEQESYLSAVEKARVSSKIEEKAQARGKGKGTGPSTTTTTTTTEGEEGGGGGGVKESKNARKKREFRQRQVVQGRKGDDDGGDEEARGERKGSQKELENVLGRLF
ncbi:hypothetical protein JCM10212_002187 [Sporobolomyces blumeae]